MSTITGKRPKLTMEQIEDVRRRLSLHREHALKRIAADMGCGIDLVRKIGRGYRPKRYVGEGR